MEYFNGSIFECKDMYNVDYIVNTVNCMGIMGAGLALEIKLRYPNSYLDYLSKCSNNLIKIGNIDIFKEDKILNFPTKFNWKFPSKLEWIELGLISFVDNYKRLNISSIAFPKLGAGSGNLNWDDVDKLINRYFANLKDIAIYICLDIKKPEGTEAEMLNIINNITFNELKQIGISNKISDLIINHKEYERFFHLSKTKGVGFKSYEKIHKYCYSNSLDINISKDEQLHFKFNDSDV